MNSVAEDRGDRQETTPDPQMAPKLEPRSAPKEADSIRQGMGGPMPAEVNRATGRQRTPSPVRKRLSAPEVMGLLLVAMAPITLGSVHPQTISLWSGLALATLAGVLIQKGRAQQPFRIPMGALALALACAWTLVQLIPLSAKMVAFIAPSTHALFGFALGDLGLYSATSWRPLSLAWPMTALEGLKYGTYLALFLAFYNGLQGRWSRRNLAMVVVGTAMVVVSAGLIHWFAEAQAFFGIYTPMDSTRVPGIRGTFVNSNHQAAFLGLSVLVGLGAASEFRRWGWQKVWMYLGICLAVVGMVVMISRGSMVALVAAGTLFLMLRKYGRIGRGWERQNLAIPVTAALLAGSLAFGVWVAAQPLWIKWQPVAHTALDEQKFRIWLNTFLPILNGHWLMGLGRGAGGMVYPYFQMAAETVHFHHLENTPLQALVEWGLPVGGIVLILLLWTLLRGIGRAASTLRLGAACALVFIALQNLADFNLEFGGTAIPATALLALLCVDTERSRRKSQIEPARPKPEWHPLSMRSRSILPWGMLACLVITQIFCFQAYRNAQATLSPRDLAQAQVQKTLTSEQIVARATEGVRLYPTDAAYMRIAALAHLNAHLDAQIDASNPNRPDLEGALWWINRSLYLDPWSADGHLLAGHILHQAGNRIQSESQYRRAISIDRRVAPAVFQYLSASPGKATYGALAKALPDGGDGWMALGRYLAGQKRPEDAVAAFVQAAQWAGFEEQGSLHAARQAMVSRDLDGAEKIRLARQWVNLDRNNWQAHYTLGRALADDGEDLAEAVASLDHAIRLRPTHSQMHLVRLRLLERLGDPELLGAAIKEFDSVAQHDPHLKVQALLFRARAARDASRHGEALALYQGAHKLAPKNTNVLLGIARTLETLGDRSGAAQNYRMAMAAAEGKLDHLLPRILNLEKQ